MITEVLTSNSAVKRFIATTGIFILCLTATIYPQLNPNVPPGSNFDLSPWKLQTINSSMNFYEVTSSQLAAGHTSQYFYTDSIDGSMVCSVPSNAGTTSGSSYPRVELRQTSRGANWSLSDNNEHILTATCRVLNVATSKPQMVIGQIHGSDDESEMIKLRWTGNQNGQCYIEARYQNNDTSKTEYGVILANGLSLGDTIRYVIKMKSGKVTTTVNGKSASQTYTTFYYGTTDKYYFKAGNYLQYNASPVVIGKAKFYRVEVQYIITGNDADDEKKSASGFILSGNYPNPFNPSTTIEYYLPESQLISVKLYNMNGVEIATLWNALQSAGTHRVMIDAGLYNLSSGVYYYRIQSSNFSKTGKMIYLR